MLCIVLLATLVMATLSIGCSQDLVEPKDQAIVKENEKANIEDALNRAVSYYPDGVEFHFVRQDRMEQELITGPLFQDAVIKQDFHIYDVIFEERKVSGVAIGVEDSSIWIYDMNFGNSWHYERFMGLPQNLNLELEPAVREPVIEMLSWGLYFMHIDTIPELSNVNEGDAVWNEAEQTLTLRATRVTGAGGTGVPDGPSFRAVVSWVSGEPELVSVEFRPAPFFNHPQQVLFSGETMYIGEDRLIEIAEYIRLLML